MSISLKDVQSQSFYNILKKVVEQFTVEINIYRLQKGINQKYLDYEYEDKITKMRKKFSDIITNPSDPETFRMHYTHSMFDNLDSSTPPQPKPIVPSFKLIITEIPEISHGQEWKRFLDGDSTFSNLYSLISIISLLPGSGQWTSLIQRLHQRLFTPKYSTGMNPNSETISIKQFYDSRLFKLTEINDNIITVLTYLQYTSLSDSTTNPTTKESLYGKYNTNTFDKNKTDTKEVQRHLITSQLNIIDSTLYTMSSITVESLLKIESKLLENFLTGTKQLSIDNYIFTVYIPLLSYNSPFLVLKDISYSFNEIVYDNTIKKYIPKSVELQMSFEPFMPRYITRNKKINQISYNNRFYIEV